ncbi:MAG: diacylglycerol kinase family protein [Bacteriovorax sp.]|nr:diacylglycerol kinase family protein [Bacteriovorax sp.]
MQNISVYLNQRASNSAIDWQGQINNALFRSHIEYQSPNNLEELYEQLDLDIINNVDAVLSVGGDGTVNTIIQRLAGTEISLLVVPGGTANDFAMVLGASSNIKRITQTIRQNIKKKIDLISINGKFMATNGGLGFASEVAQEINELRINYPQFKKVMKFSGKSIYSIFLAKKLLNREIKNYTFSITSNEFTETLISPLILVNNQPALGGDFTVAPDTNHQDGKFNITIFKHQSRLELIRCIIKILNGNYPYNDKNLVSFETESVKIELIDNQSICFFGDGEIFDQGKNWNIRCHANFLSVFSPHNQEDLVNICTKGSLM